MQQKFKKVEKNLNFWLTEGISYAKINLEVEKNTTRRVGERYELL